MSFYCTSYCNQPHRMSDGYPLGHECHVLPTAALTAEFFGNVDRAVELIQEAKPLKISMGVRCKHVWGPNYRWTEFGVRELIPVCCEHCGVTKEEHNG